MSTAAWDSGPLARIRELCEADPAREACGFVVRRGGAAEVVQLENVADRHHALDPAAFPRTSRDGYLMDPHDLLRLHAELAAVGGEIVAVWHSHVEAGARLSDADRAGATVDGQPLLPGAEQLVFGLRRGRVAEVRRYRFDGGAFVEVPPHAGGRPR